MLGWFWIALPAMAFRPDPTTHIGSQPSRLLRFHKEQQWKHMHSLHWQRFVESDGHGWKARFDERTGGAIRAWGPGIELKDISTLQAVEASIRTFFAAHPKLLGVPLDALVLGRSGYLPDADGWLIQFDEVIPGTDISVWRGGLSVRIQHGRMVMFGVDTHPSAMSIPIQPTLDESRALQIAMALGPAANAQHTESAVALTALPIDNGHSLKVQLSWEVRTKTKDPKGHWVSFVDAHSGALLNVHNEVRFAAGVVQGQHDVRTVNGEMTESPLSGMRLSTDSSVTYSDDGGAWSLADVIDPVEGDLTGKYIRIRNQDGANSSFADMDGEVLLTADDASQAELSSYVFQNQIRDWARAYAPDLDLIESRIEVNVNINEICNAYFDGDLNFMRAGGGCNNTGRIADVNFHEWGHAFHYYIMETGVFDGAVSEGIGDIVSALNTGDSILAPHFFETGEGIRDLAPDRVYPDDWVNEVHEDGLIFGGAVWDLWTLLEEELGEEEAYDTVNRLFVRAVKAGPTTPVAFDEFIFADDDNGNLGDGTPNSCTIIEAFARHGLGPGGNGGLVQLMHEAVGLHPANVDIPMGLDIINVAPQCTDVEIEAAELWYSTDQGESWQTVALRGDEERLEAQIPPQPNGTVVSYYFTIQTGESRTSQAPRGGIINPYSLYVGDLTELYCEDFESTDGGFTHRLIAGIDEEGADDWQWGTPIGMGGDPDFAHSGNRVWGNDLGGGQYNGEYQDNKHNQLQSPPIDAAGQTNLVLRYRRWLNVEDGHYDQAKIVANGVQVWTNHATSRSIGDEHHRDDQWMEHVVPITIESGVDLTLQWELVSDQGLSMGGWNIDDVCVYAVGNMDVGGAEGADDRIPEDAYQRGDVWIVEGEKVGCACSTGDSGPGMGWLGLLLTGLLAAVRRRER